MLIKFFSFFIIYFTIFLKISTKNLITKENDVINIHVVPHTHDDAGWLWTFEEYYLGTGGSKASVEKILDNFIISLEENKNRTFIYVEMGFFIKWYKTQTQETKNKIKNFINEKRFEFINGGYVMHDEATTYYQDIIDQTRIGLMFLKKEFDFTPDIAWFIDPFGHSAASALILSKMGFKKIAFVRIDYKEKEFRKKNKSLEFYWFPYDKINNKAKIFTHVTFDHYCPPPSLDKFLSEEELNLPQDEIITRSNNLVKDLNLWNSGYKHNNVLLMYGCDFTFYKKNSNYLNLEKVMDYINNNQTVNNITYGNNTKKIVLKYSTPSRYFDEIFGQVENWPVYKNFDFFPYAEFPYSYWTGFYTSRPYLKGLVREAGNYLRSLSILSTELILKQKINNNNILFEDVSEEKKKLVENKYLKKIIDSIYILRENLAICQHHDAVAGTAKEKVSLNYQELLQKSINLVKNKFFDFSKNKNNKEKNYNFCIDPTVDTNCFSDFFNFEKIKEKHNSNEIVFKILNPGINSDKPKIISFDVQGENYELYQFDGKQKKSEVLCVEIKPKESKNCINCRYPFIKEYNNCKIYFQHKFKKKQIFAFFILKKIEDLEKNTNQKNSEIDKKIKFTDIQDLDDPELIKNFSDRIKKENNIYKIYLSDNSFLIWEKNSTNLNFEFNEGQSNFYKFSLNHGFYTEYEKNNSHIKPNDVNPSGAYVLSTTELYPKFFGIDLEESYIQYGEYINRLVFRYEQSTLIINHLKNHENIIETESIWDPVISRENPREFLFLLNSNLNNTINPKIINKFNYTNPKQEFWTDSNGLNLIRRIKDVRLGYNYNITEKVAANFYPVNSIISLRERDINYEFSENDYEGLSENNRMISVLNDRSQSAGGMKEGQIIIIQNRFSNLDDWKGLEESLFETSSMNNYFSVKNYLVFNTGENNQNYKDVNFISEIIQKKIIFFKEDSDHEMYNEKILKEKIDNIQNQYLMKKEIKKGKIEEINKNISSYIDSENVDENKSLLNHIIETNGKIIVNYHIIDVNNIFIQFFNECDIYFSSEGCKNGTYRFKNYNGLNYDIEEYNLNGVSVANANKMNRNRIIIGKFQNLAPMDFKLYKLNLR